MESIRTVIIRVIITKLPESDLFNFYTQIRSSQSEERAVFITGEKIDMSNQNCDNITFSRFQFLHVRKIDTSNQKPQRCMSFEPKFPSGTCCLQRPRFASCFTDIRGERTII